MLTYNQRYRPRTTREYTKSDLTVYDSAGNTALNALTVYGKSEVVDGEIKSAGEGYAVVDLGTLDWRYDDIFYSVTISNKIKQTPNNQIANLLIDKYTAVSRDTLINSAIDDTIAINIGGTLQIRDTAYTDATAFKTAMSGVLLCYQLADPSQGNAIAIKTDNGSGIDGTMAVFETGTPLRGIPDTTGRDVMVWDGSAGTVTKNCAKVRLADLTWDYNTNGNYFFTNPANIISAQTKPLCDKYSTKLITVWTEMDSDKLLGIFPQSDFTAIRVNDYSYTTVSDFVASLGDAELVYELATPTTEPLTQTENESIAGLHTFANTTHFTNNADTDMTANYTMRVPTI